MVNYAGSKWSKKCDIMITELWITGGTINESRVLNASYPFLSSPQNLIAQSQSGTGKTAAFVLAMLSHVDPENRWPQVWNASEAVNVMHGYNSTVLVLMSLWLCVQCLCVSPTYELALQTGKVIEQMGKFYPEVQLVYAIRGNKCKLFYFRSKDFLHNSLVTQYLEYVDYYVFLTFRFLIDPMMLPSKENYIFITQE